MTRIERIAKIITEEYKDGNTATLHELIRKTGCCRMCQHHRKEDIAYTNKESGKLEFTRCIAVIAMNSDDYSLGCDQGINEYLNEEVEDDGPVV